MKLTGRSDEDRSTSNSAPPDLSGFPEPHAAQQEIEDNAERFNVVVCGRRWGKTEYGKRKLAEKAGEGLPAAYLAPTFPMAHKCYRELVEALQGQIARKEENKRIELLSGGAIDIWSMENGGDRVRGQKYARVVLDECAMVVGLVNLWEKVIRPTLADYRGDAWFLSTPRRGSGFEEMYERGGREPGWRAWRMPTSTNPFIAKEEIEAAKEGSSAQAFASEWLADFEASESDLVYILDRDKTLKPAQVPWGECKWRVVGIDPGGGDPTAIIPIGVTQNEHLHQYGEFYRRGDVTLEMIANYLGKLGPIDRVFVGETGGNVLTNSLYRMGFPALKAEMKRGEGIETVRWLMENGRLTIDPGCKESIAEFPGYRWAKRRDGETGEKYATSTPDENHADAMDARRYAVMGVIQSLPTGGSKPMRVVVG